MLFFLYVTLYTQYNLHLHAFLGQRIARNGFNNLYILLVSHFSHVYANSLLNWHL